MPTVAVLSSWQWAWITDPPEQFGDNFPVDVVRLAVVIAGALHLAQVGRTLREQTRRHDPFPRGRSAALLSWACGDIYVCGTEAAVFGTPATPRLLVAIAIVALGWYGVTQMRRQQRDLPIKDQ